METSFPSVRKNERRYCESPTSSALLFSFLTFLFSTLSSFSLSSLRFSTLFLSLFLSPLYYFLFSFFFSCLVSIPLSTFCPFFLSIWSWNSGTLPVRTRLARSRENFEFTSWISCWSFICSGCTCRNWLASKLSRIQPSKKFLDPRDKSS